MIAADAFLAMFTLQILAMSALYPAWFTRYMRMKATSIPAERLAQLYPGVDPCLARERFLTRYRGLNTGIAVLGLLLLGWLFNYMRGLDWGVEPVDALEGVYFMVQALLPLGLVARYGVRFKEARKRSLLEGKRKALLQRRGLFDFVSPFMVFLAALSYFLFAVLVIYMQQHSSRGHSGLINTGLIEIGAVTLVYAQQAYVVYAALYGKKPQRFETHERRMRTIGLVVKSCVYSCIACVVFLSLNFTLGLLDLRQWEPFILSVFFVTTALVSLMGMTPAPRPPEGAGVGREQESAQ